MIFLSLLSVFCWALFSREVSSFSLPASKNAAALLAARTHTPCSFRPMTSLTVPAHLSNNNDGVSDRNRRTIWLKSATRVASWGIAGAALAALTRPAWASSKSRTDGYEVQKTEQEWKTQLSPMQYNILRQGGTERPYFSILESEKRSGTYECAGCGTPLFSSKDKFKSGTGWPSFARGLDGVETEAVDPITANVAGAELRCATCGGHLGDVFNDGFLFVGTEAFKTGKRYCIDGAALVFYPENMDKSLAVRGDKPPPKKEAPSWLDPPKIAAQEEDA